MKKLLVIVLISLGFLVSGCGDYLDGKDVKNTKVVQVAVDEVKLISESITDPMDARTYNAENYPVYANSRLLMKLGIMKASIQKIVKEQPVLFRIVVKAGELEFAGQSLRICPLTSQWFMRATWRHSYYSHSKPHWGKLGGDFDERNCMYALDLSSPIFDKDHPEEKEFCSGDGIICFDIKNYVNAYIRVHNVDFGFGLINPENQVIQVFGDKTVQGPEIMWRRLKSYY